MRKKDNDVISLIYEKVIGDVLVVYQVQNEVTARILYIKEFYIPVSKVSSFLDYLKTELSNKGYNFKLDESNSDGFKEYSAINRKGNRYFIHKFTFVRGNIESIKNEYFIGIDSAKQLFIPMSPTEIASVPIFNFIKDAKFENEKSWPR